MGSNIFLHLAFLEAIQIFIQVFQGAKLIDQLFRRLRTDAWNAWDVVAFITHKGKKIEQHVWIHIVFFLHTLGIHNHILHRFPDNDVVTHQLQQVLVS